jgi:hypothetical protein
MNDKALILLILAGFAAPAFIEAWLKPNFWLGWILWWSGSAILFTIIMVMDHGLTAESFVAIVGITGVLSLMAQASRWFSRWHFRRVVSKSLPKPRRSGEFWEES